MVESDLSAEVNSTTVLPKFSNLSTVLSSTNDSVTISWQNNDDSSDGGIDIEKSLDGGSTWNSLATGLTPSTTEYTDTDISLYTTYDYKIIRSTDHTSVEETVTADLTLNPPIVSGVSVNSQREVVIESVDGNDFVSGGSVTVDKTHIYRTTTQNATFPDEYTLVDTVNGEVSNFTDLGSLFETNVFYAVTIEFNSNESPATEFDTFIPSEDAVNINSSLPNTELNPDLNS